MRLKNTGFALPHIVAVGNVRKLPPNIPPAEMEWGSPKIGMMTQPLRQIISSMLRCKWVEKWKWSGKTCSKGVVHQNLLDAVRS